MAGKGSKAAKETGDELPDAKPDANQWRDRIVDVQKMRAGDILPHVGNWRRHGKAQADATRGVLGEVGKISALHAWYSERNGGKLTYFDGHLRRDLRPDEEWTILITDLTDEEADYALSTFDPIAAMADADAAALDALLQSVNSGEEAVQQILADLAQSVGLYEEVDQNYSRKIEPPIYEPQGEKPSIDELYDDSKTKELVSGIDAAEGLTEQEKEFLRIAAQRHTVLNFSRIANYYAHSPAEVQSVMEDSALVIIDFNKAIEQGFISFSNEIAKIARADGY